MFFVSFVSIFFLRFFHEFSLISKDFIKICEYENRLFA